MDRIRSVDESRLVRPLGKIPLAVRNPVLLEMFASPLHPPWTSDSDLIHSLNGRGEMIRTSDPLHPMQVGYQAALRPDRTCNYSRGPLPFRICRTAANSPRKSLSAEGNESITGVVSLLDGRASPFARPSIN